MPTPSSKPVNPRAPEPASTETYANAYAKLTALAEKLKNGAAAASIDSLVETVREAKVAHMTCASRIEAVRAEIDAELASLGEDTNGRA